MAEEDKTTFAHPRFARIFPEMLRAAAQAYGDDNAITLKHDLKNETASPASLSFRQLESQSRALAKALIARSVGKGTRVGFIFGNGPGFAITLAAIARIGAIAIPISTLIKANELVRVLRQSDAAGLIVQRKQLGHDYVERLCDALPALRNSQCQELRLTQAPYLRWIASTGDALPASIVDCDRMEESEAGISDELLLELESQVHPTDQMLEIYTSGSMALPKGVKHNHGPVLFRADYIRSMTRIERGAQVAAPMPMFWVGGLMMALLPSLQIGATVNCAEATSTSSRFAMGSVLAEDDLQALPKNPTTWALGMTETLGPYSYADVLRVPGYPLSPPLDHVADRFEVRLALPDGTEAADGQVGEIQVRGYALTPGLHKVERDGYFTSDGFYRTGDLGVVDDGRLHFVGRDGDVIKTASANVSPAEVELEMQQLDGVHSAYVVGIPDRERGQLVVAAVVARAGARLDFEAIRAQLQQRLSGFKVPRAYVAITREQVPMLPSNKVSRRQLEQLLSQRLGRDGTNSPSG